MLSFALTGRGLHGPQESRQALVDDLAALPGVSQEYAFRLVNDFEVWSIDHARFITKDITPLIAPQLKAAVRTSVAPTLTAVILFGVATAAVSVAALVSIRRTRRAFERR